MDTATTSNVNFEFSGRRIRVVLDGVARDSVTALDDFA